MADEPQYAKPTSQVDLERRLENDNKSDRVLTWSDNYEPPEDAGEGRTFAVEGNDLSGYVGTSPEYATYANETEAPLAGDESAEQKVFDTFTENAGPVALTYSDGEKQDAEAARETEKPTAKKAASSRSSENNG